MQARIAGVLLALGLAAGALGWPPAPPLAGEAEATEAGPLPPSVEAFPASPGLWRCEFRFKPPTTARSVALVGSFNNWNAAATPMQAEEDTGRYFVAVELPAGVHSYKFVMDGDKWIHDQLNMEKEPDGFTGFNSVLRLGRMASLKDSDAARGDGKLDLGGLEHRSDRALYFQWLAADRVLVRCRTLANDAQRVSVAIEGGPTLPMRSVMRGPLYELYEAEAAIPPGAVKGRTKVLTYTFVYEDGPLKGSDPQSFTASYSDGLVFKTPEWARHAIWYQIMVDRFRNGDPGNDPDPVRPWTSEWFTPSPWETAGGESFYKWFVFHRLYGGDIAGVEWALPYLKALGVNALYFNPIFKAPSHHKYDATNYLHIDDYFGTRGDYGAAEARENLLDAKTWVWTESDKRFLKFLNAAKAQGFRVILDGVFNHVGTEHPAFQDVKKRGKESPFADWFDVTSWEPFQYNGWAGHDSLPVFKKTASGLYSDSLRQHIYDVTRRWMDPDGDGDPRDGIDGWRLDVPNELPMEFWVGWRKHVKSINPDAYICGEIWDRADAWLDGRHFDAVMNYQFADPVVAWVFNRERKLKVSELDRRLAELRLAYPAAATYVLQNLINSHDTDRLASMAQNPDRGFDRMNRVQDDNPEYDNSKPTPDAYARARLVAFVQMTYVGAPMIYYGDEVGMWGADDPTCRKPMLWEDLQPYAQPSDNAVMKDHLAAYQRMIGLRAAHEALRVGSFETLLTDDAADVWVFERAAGEDRVVVALNASTQRRAVRVPMSGGGPQSWRDALQPEGPAQAVRGGVLELEIAPLSGVALIPAR